MSDPQTQPIPQDQQTQTTQQPADTIFGGDENFFDNFPSNMFEPVVDKSNPNVDNGIQNPEIGALNPETGEPSPDLSFDELTQDIQHTPEEEPNEVQPIANSQTNDSNDNFPDYNPSVTVNNQENTEHIDTPTVNEEEIQQESVLEDDKAPINDGEENNVENPETVEEENPNTEEIIPEVNEEVEEAPQEEVVEPETEETQEIIPETNEEIEETETNEEEPMTNDEIIQPIEEEVQPEVNNDESDQQEEISPSTEISSEDSGIPETSSDIVLKYQELNNSINQIYDLRNIDSDEEFTIVGADNDKMRIVYDISKDDSDPDRNTINITKIETDIATDEETQHILQFIFEPNNNAIQVVLDDILLFDEIQDLQDDPKKKMQVMEKLNKFIFLTGEEIKKAKKEKEAKEEEEQQRKQLYDIFRNF